MRKTIKLTILLLMLCGITKAQSELEFGVKGGANYTGFHTGSSAGTTEFGINIGGIVEYAISTSISLQAELLYNQKGGEFPVRDNSNPNIVISSVNSKLAYIDIPILAKIYISNKFSFEVGPQIGFNISEKSELDGTEIETEIKTLDTAIVGGFGYQFDQGIFIQARYAYGLSELFENERYKNSVISLSLGYKFN